MTPAPVETTRKGYVSSLTFDIPSAAADWDPRASGSDVEVTGAGRQLRKTACAMVGEGADASVVGRLVALTIDAMTCRLIELAIARLGEPPVPWSWLALGSAARLEQAIATDQDHALAFDPQGRPLEELDRYFLQLARSVTAGLEAAGIPRCRADVVAENPSLRRPLDHWVEAFNRWMGDPGISSVRQASVLFDIRRVAGPLDAERTLREVIRSSSRRPEFLRQFAAQSVDVRPPGDRFRGASILLQGSRGAKLDIKRGGLTPIVNLARSYAIEAGVMESGTLARLDHARELGRLHESARSHLAEAFQLFWRIRLKHQARCVEDGRPADDLVELRCLGASERKQLRDALLTIRRAQHSLRREHGLSA